MTIAGNGNVGIGITNPSTSLHISGTDALILPVGENSDRPTGVNGMIRYNSESDTFEGYSESSWVSLGSSGATTLNGLGDVLSGSNSLYIGHEPSSTAEYNVAVGVTALEAITTGNNNAAVGYNALTANTSGKENTAIGRNALSSLNPSDPSTESIGNVAIGMDTLTNLTTGTYNITIGKDVGETITTGKKNIIIGYAEPSSSDAVSQIVIGEEAVGHGNKTLVIGGRTPTSDLEYSGEYQLESWEPGSHGVTDLGASTYSFKNAYITGSIYIGGSELNFSDLAGTVSNTSLDNSAITVSDGSNSTDISLGETITFTQGSGITISESGGTITISGLTIGTDVQAYNANLAAIADLEVTNGGIIVGDGATFVLESGATARTSLGLGSAATSATGDFIAASSVSTFGASLIDDTDASTARSTLELEIGSDVQAYNANLAAIADLEVTNGGIIVGDGATFVLESGATARTSLGLGSAATSAAGDFIAASSVSTFGASLIDDTDASTARSTLELEMGSDVQAYNANLAAIADLEVTNGGIIVGDGATFVLESGATARTALGLGSAATSATGDFIAASSVSTFGASLIDDTDASTARSTLELEIGSDVQAYNANLEANIIAGGAMDNITIGSTTAAEGTFTTLTATKNSSSITNPTLLVNNIGTSGQDSYAEIRGARNSATSSTSNLTFSNYDKDLDNQIGYMGQISGRITNASTNVGGLSFSTSSDGSSGNISERMFIDNNGNVGIGITNPITSLHISGTDALILPVGENSDRPTGVNGMIRYNSESDTFEGYSESSWVSLGSSGATTLNGLGDVLSGSNSLYIGHEPSSTAEYNVAVGVTALDAITTGNDNTAVGYNALTANTSGKENTAIGRNALSSLNPDDPSTESIGNVAIGMDTLTSLTTGTYNIAIGKDAGETITTGKKNIIIGYAEPSSSDGENQIVIGEEGVGHGNNILVIGGRTPSGLEYSGSYQLDSWEPGSDGVH